MENEQVEASKPSGSKKSWKTICVWGVAIVVLAGLCIFLKNRMDSQNGLVSNRVIASKNIKLGIPLPENVDQEIDVDLLQKDADEGNQISKDTLALYKHKKAAETYLSLGVTGSEKVPAELDLELLKADAAAGSTEATMQLALMKQREILLPNFQLGKEFPAKLLDELDMELLKRDADAGNDQVKLALSLIKNRSKAEALCVLGKPFALDFYKQVDRSILVQDAEAGKQSTKEILKLADNRIKAEELTFLYQDYKEDFFEQIDKELLIADADAGNSDMQFIWASANRVIVKPVDYALIVKYLTMCAAQNNPRGQNYLGYMYNTGDGVEIDYDKAAELYKAAADQGYLTAMTNLSGSLSKGRGVKRDIEASKAMLRKAAESGDAAAQANLGYYLGHGVNWYERNPKEGLEWLKKSCDQHYVPGINAYLYLLRITMRGTENDKLIFEALRMGLEADDLSCMAWYGRALCNGKGTERNQAEGMKWIRKSHDANNEDGMIVMADMLKDGGGGLKVDVAEAVKLYEILVKNKNVTSMYHLGMIYSNGKGNVKPDHKLAVKYIEMYLDFINRGYNEKDFPHSYPEILMAIARIYRNGKGVERDIQKAIKYFERSTFGMVPDSCLELGLIYQDAEYGVQDSEKMLKYFAQGAKQGQASCINLMGVEYEKGELIPKDGAKAVEHYKLAAQKNDKSGLFNLARLYEGGLLGVKKDMIEAVKFYDLAAQKGNAFAQCKLGTFNLKEEAVAKDVPRAVKYFEQGAKQNNGESLYHLGCIYGTGEYADLGFKKDKKLALEYFNKSLQAGYEPAAEAIKELNAEE